MASLNGTWKLMDVDNFASYLEKIGVSDVNIPRAMKLLTPENNITQEIEINGENVRIKTNTPVASSEVKADLNTEVEIRSLDGRDTKATYSLEDNQLIECVTGAFDSRIVRRVDGESMVMDMTCGDVTSSRKYERV